MQHDHVGNRPAPESQPIGAQLCLSGGPVDQAPECAPGAGILEGGTPCPSRFPNARLSRLMNRLDLVTQSPPAGGLPDAEVLLTKSRGTRPGRGMREQLFALFANDGEVGKAILAPPGMPAATVAMLRRAFDAMVKDRDYIADADKLQLETDSLSGERLQKLIESVMATPPAVIEPCVWPWKERYWVMIFWRPV